MCVASLLRASTRCLNARFKTPSIHDAREAECDPGSAEQVKPTPRESQYDPDADEYDPCSAEQVKPMPSEHVAALQVEILDAQIKRLRGVLDARKRNDSLSSNILARYETVLGELQDAREDARGRLKDVQVPMVPGLPVLDAQEDLALEDITVTVSEHGHAEKDEARFQHHASELSRAGCALLEVLQIRQAL